MKKLGYLFILGLFSVPTIASEFSGEMILKEKCSRCHATPDPNGYDAAAWASNVDRMAPNASLNAKEIKAIKKLNIK